MRFNFVETALEHPINWGIIGTPSLWSENEFNQFLLVVQPAKAENFHIHHDLNRFLIT